MTKEQAELEAKAEEEATAETEAKDAEFEASLEGLSEEEITQKRAEKEANSEHSQDEEFYKTELEKEKEGRKKAEKAAADKAFKLREANRKKDDDEVEIDEDKPLTAKGLQTILAQERQVNQKEIRMSQAEDKIRKLTTSAPEADLITEIFKNRSFPEYLSLDEQIEEAYVIANRKKLISERNEALRGLKGKTETETTDAPTHHDQQYDQQTDSQFKIAPDEKLVMSQSGFTYNNQIRRWEKKLKNGKILARDPKTKEVRIM